MNDYGDYDRGDQRQEPADPLTNIDAEAALLGGMLLDNKLIVQWSDRLHVTDFYEPLHSRIYSALLKFAAKGLSVNAIALRPIFASDEAAFGGDYLNQLVDSPAAAIGANEFAAQIIDLSNRRDTRNAMRMAEQCLATDFDTPISEIAARVETAAFAASTRTETKPSKSLAQMIQLAVDRVSRIQDDGEAPGMLNALVPDLDRVIGPMETGYHIFAGRPGMGKTTLAGSVSLGYAINGHEGVYCSGEMSEEQLGMRQATDAGFAMGFKIKHEDLRLGKVTPGERQQLLRVVARAELLPLQFVDMRNANIRRVWTECARRKALLAAQGKTLKFCVVDSIGLFTADIDGKLIDDDRKKVNTISAFLNMMAHALDIAVIALNQLSRGVEGRVNKRPMLADLKESGNLEQDADSVTFIYREEYYLEQSEPKRGETGEKGRNLWEEWDLEMRAARGKAELIGAKNRHGKTLSKTVNFIAQYFSVRATNVYDVGIDDPVLV